MKEDIFYYLENEQIEDALKLIEEDKVDYNQVNEDGETPLMYACYWEDVFIALLKTGKANPGYIHPENGLSVLMMACERTLPKGFPLLLETEGVDIGYVEPKKGNTALTIASAKHKSENALLVLATGKAKPEHVNKEGMTALLIACKNTKIDIALALLKSGHANPGHVNPTNGKTALIMACSNDRLKKVAFALIGLKDANVGHADHNGNTALMLASDEDTPDLALALLRTGQSNPRNLNKDGETALMMMAGEPDYLEPLSLLLTMPDARIEHANDINSMTALMVAIVRGNKPAVFKLLATGKANVEHADKAGDTAFTYACTTQQPEIALALLDTGKVDLEEPMKNGRTALEIAEETLPEIARQMKQRMDEYYVKEKVIPLKSLRAQKRKEFAERKATRKTKSPRTPNNGKAFDPILREKHSVEEWLAADTDNIIFVVNGKKWCMKRLYFMENVLSPYTILLDCVKGKSGRYNSLDETYIDLQTVGITNAGILPVKELHKITASTARIYEFHKSSNRISTVRQLEMTASLIHNKKLATHAIDLHQHDLAGVVERKYIRHVKDYTYKWDARVNYYLRSGKTDDEFVKDSVHLSHYAEYAQTPEEALAKIKAKIRAFDEIFSKFATISTVPITVYRGVKDDAPAQSTPVPALDTSNPLSKYSPYQGFIPSYMSTSNKREVAVGFSNRTDCCVYEYTIQPGVPFISLYRHSVFQSEFEILLPRGLTTVVKGVKDEDGLRTYVTEVRLTTPDQYKHMEHQCVFHPVLTFAPAHGMSRATRHRSLSRAKSATRRRSVSRGRSVLRTRSLQEKTKKQRVHSK